MELKLLPIEIEELRKLQRNLQGRSDYARVTCILMLAMGNAPDFVANCLGIDISTVYRYRSLYIAGGVDKLLENRYKGYQGLLNILQIESLKQELRTHLYTDSKQVVQWVKDTFDITYTPQGMTDLLNAHDVTDVIALDCECVNATSTKELYELALKKHPNAKNIYIISDNARYYRNKELQNWVKDTKIK